MMIDDIEQLTQRAESGDADAQYVLAERYLDGEGVTRNARTAASFLRQAAEKNHLAAIDSLGDCYRFGIGVTQDAAQAFELYRRAAEQGHALSQSSLGYCFYNGEGIDADLAQAVQWFRAAAEQGDTYAQRMMGSCLLAAEGVERDYAQGIAFLKRAAEDDDQWAQFRLGEVLRTGEGVPPDYAEALKWYRLAADQGHETSKDRLRGVSENELYDDTSADDFLEDAQAGLPHAQFRLAECYWQGNGVPKDYERAARWLKRAAMHGHAEAQLLLARFYEDGTGVERDIDKAYELYARAAGQGHATALRILGDWTMQGNVVERDAHAAVDYYQRSSELGDHTAQLALANCYYDGIGVDVDYAQAARHYRSAAEHDVVDAMVRLGECLLEGRGCDRNEVEGVQWLRDAANAEDNENLQSRIGQCYLSGIGVIRDEAEARTWFEWSAEEGFAEAQFSLGRCFESPATSLPDFATAVDWYTKAARQGLPAAIAALGKCLLIGQGVEQDRERGVRLLHQAARKHDPVGQFWLGHCCEQGIGIRKNLRNAARCYDAAARKKHAVAQTKLAEFFVTGTAVARNLDYARRWLEFAISHGNASAMVLLGYLHEAHLVDGKSTRTPQDLYQRAARLGYAFADASVPHVLPLGQTAEWPDISLPADWFQRMVNDGDAFAWNNLGMCHLDGIGVPLDYESAFQCFAKASEKGLAVARENLARCYRRGIGVAPDISKAIQLHRAAAEAGDARGKFSLGQCYRFGIGVDCDLDVARDLIHAAADAKEPRAMLVIGEIHEATAANARDVETAVRFYRRAIDANQEAAIPAARRAELRLREDETYVPTAIIPDSIEDIGDDLLPVVRPLAYFEFTKLRLEIHGTNSGEAWPYQVLADHLGVGLVYDLPRAMQYVMQEHLDQWGVTLYECLERARDNLREMAIVDFEEVDDGVFVCSMCDDYDPSRMLLNDEIRELPLRGKPIAMVPNVTLLIVTGSEDGDGLRAMFQLAREALQNKEVRQVSSLAFCLHEFGWLPWLPDSGTSTHELFRLLRLQHDDRLYAEQAGLLEQLYGDSKGVVKFSSRRNPATNRVETYCQWPYRVARDCLLPRTDVIQFVADTKKSEPPAVIVEADWEEVQNLYDGILKPLDIYPQRFQTSAIPENVDLLRLLFQKGQHEIVQTELSQRASRSLEPSRCAFKTSRCNVYRHRDFVLEVDADDAESQQFCPRMVAVIEDMVASGSVFQPGQTFQYGWLVLLVEQFDDEYLTIHEPDMKSWPIRYVPGVTQAVKHAHAHHAAVHSFDRSIGEPDVPSMKHDATVCGHVGKATSVLMERTERTDSAHSGWVFDCVDDDHDHFADDSYKIISLYEAYLREPLILDFLALPCGVTVSLDGGRLNFVEFDANDPVEIAVDSYLDDRYERTPADEDLVDEVDLDDDDLFEDEDELEMLVGQAIGLNAEEKHAEAIELLDRAIALQDDDSEPFYWRGNSRHELKQLEAALDDYNQAIRLSSSESYYFVDRGRLLDELGRLEEAIADCERALEVDPEDYSAAFNLGWYCKRQGRFDQAIANFKAAIALSPDEPEAFNEIACIQVARDDVQNRDARAAVEYATRACELSLWEDSSHLDTLAAALAGAGRFEEAVKWQARALDLSGEDDESGMRFRLDLYRRGQPLRVTNEFPFA